MEYELSGLKWNNTTNKYENMSIVEFFESLGSCITGSDISSKKTALVTMSNYLSELAYSNTNTISVHCLVEFYVNILSEHYDLLPPILQGLAQLVDCDNFSANDAKLIASKLVQLDVPQFNPKTRLQVYKLLEDLLNDHLEPLRSLGDAFLRDFINAIDGENSPDCVYAVMRMNKYIVERFPIGAVYEEYFESISAYFPIEFKASGNKSGSGLTREMLVEVNKQCMLASPLFGPQLLPMLLEKITSDKQSARIEGFDILTDGFPLMDFSDVLNYHMSFTDSLLIEVKTRVDETQQHALRCMAALARVFQDKADEAALLEFTWHVFEVVGGVVMRDTLELQFLKAAIDDNPRVWCAISAKLLPAMMDKCVVQLDNPTAEDRATDLLNVMADVLAAGANWPSFTGLVNSPKARHFFTRLHLVFTDMVDSPVTEHSQKKLSIMSRLLGYYSLFGIWLPACGAEANFTTDTETITRSRIQLVSSAIGRLVLMSSDYLDQALQSLVPLLMTHQQQLQPQGNGLMTTITDYARHSSGGVLQDIAFRLLGLAPAVCVPMVLSAMGRQLASDALPVFDAMSRCLVTLVDRFSVNVLALDEVCAFIADPLLGNLLANQASLSDETITNMAIVLGSLGTPTDDRAVLDILKRLLDASDAHNPSQPCVVWLCSILGQSAIGVIEQCIAASDLLRILHAMICSTPQQSSSETITLLCQVYASVVSKSSGDSALEDIVNGHCEMADGAAGDHLTTLLLWTLKGSMLSGHTSLSSNLARIITDPSVLSGSTGRSLARFIEILHRTANEDSSIRKRQFCQEEKLFPFAGFLYDQYSYITLAQSYLRLASGTGDNGAVRDISMELYLRLIANYGTAALSSYIDEVLMAVDQWLKQFASHTSAGGSTTPLSARQVSVRLYGLRAIYNLHSRDNNLRLDCVLDIGENIRAICEASTELVPQDRLLLAKLVGWFVMAFRDQYDTHRHAFQKCVKRFICDKKRIVRQEAARSMMVLFC